MRFGICSSPEKTEQLVDAEFDFVEWRLSSTVGELSQESYSQFRRWATRLPLRPEAWNVLLPPRIKVVGPAADHRAMTQYFEVALRRAAELGASVVVFGSGPSRSVPDDWPRKRAVEQLDDAFGSAGEVGRRNGVMIAIEPIQRAKTNIINTVAEGAAAVGRVNHPNVSLLADLGHLTNEGEDLADTVSAGSLLAHVHVVTAERTMPVRGRDEKLVGDFLTALQRGGYNGRVSLECPWSDAEEARAGSSFLRNMWDATTKE